MTHRNARGFALVFTIFALVLIAALVTGAFFAAEQELRVARNGADAQRALAAAEAAADLAISDWDGSLNTMTVGDSETVGVTLPAGSSPAGATVLRLNAQLFLVRATGGDPAAGTSRSVGRLARLDLPGLAVNAVVSILTPADPGAASTIDGTDRDPPGWVCDTLQRDTVPEVTVGPWPVDWDSLAALARTAVDPVAVQAELGAGRPLILARGDVSLTGGGGRGLLLVDGDLTIQGGFELDGVVVVRGTLTMTGSAGTIRGAVVAAALRTSSASTGAAALGYSSCAVSRALEAAAVVRPIGRRGWAQLF